MDRLDIAAALRAQGCDDPSVRRYVHGSLTAALRAKSSSLRAYFDARFPNVRPLQVEYRSGCGPLLVEGGEANPQSVGTSFDTMVQYELDPLYAPKLAILPFLQPGWEPGLAPVVLVARHAYQSAVEGDVEGLARASWALGLCVEVFRAQRMTAPLAALAQQCNFTASGLLDLASGDALRQMLELDRVAQERLYPSILPARSLAIGPTFDASALCNADADLIHDGRLLDIKTHLGKISKATGGRRDSLELVDLYQVLGYALFDRSDTYQIRTIGLYSARYGFLATWPLEEALERLAGQPVDLSGEREWVWELLDQEQLP